MLDLVERMLPFGSEQWENLAACYNTHKPSGHAERDGDSLSRKFKKLYKVPKPSGNGTCPPHITRSKRLKRMTESSITVKTLHSDADTEDNSEDELDSADASGSEDLLAAFDQAAEESQSLLFIPQRDAADLTNTPPITNSAPLTPQAVSQAVAPALVATARAGMAPSELAALSKQLAQNQLKRNATSAGVLSQTAQRRRWI
ncbi:unnamed protein product [Phytophthora fragariaefolia]|uniref:Unnamed protein product n=1 Tax=Phytophthora fragariaefolia TaxID=1490495 RepID=A0A9W6XLM2_9STRA|nr:unnamed protein product [Phytophthora fragariaefolia]